MWLGIKPFAHQHDLSRLAKTFYALTRNLQKLRGYYVNQNSSHVITLGTCYFPSITAYRENGQIVKFEYVEYLEKDMACVTLHERTYTEPPRDIVVKFVENYGEDAH